MIVEGGVVSRNSVVGPLEMLEDAPFATPPSPV